MRPVQAQISLDRRGLPRDQAFITENQTIRLDQRLVADDLAPTRARARDLILRGFVRVDGVVCTKPARNVGAGARVALAAGTPGFVSRGAEKLVAALDHFKLDPSGCVALDVGCSTGGFTQVLLARGAAKVYAVDVGRGQLHETLQADPCVVLLESQDARALTRNLVPDPIEVIVADVSFIALTKVLAPVLALAGPGAFLVALIKPQFELSPEDIGKGGIVRDEAARQRAVDNVRVFMTRQKNWRTLGLIPSPIAGGSGNEEFLIAAVNDA